MAKVIRERYRKCVCESVREKVCVYDHIDFDVIGLESIILARLYEYVYVCLH